MDNVCVQGSMEGWPMGEVRQESQAETFRRMPKLRLSRGQKQLGTQVTRVLSRRSPRSVFVCRSKRPEQAETDRGVRAEGVEARKNVKR
ncbi:rCG37218, partial [Rattus norvegicus]